MFCLDFILLKNKLNKKLDLEKKRGSPFFSLTYHFYFKN